MTRKELFKYIDDIEDRLNVVRLEKLLRRQIRPLFIVIGLNTNQVVPVFKLYIQGFIGKFDYEIDLSTVQNEYDLRSLLLQRNKDIFIAVNFDNKTIRNKESNQQEHDLCKAEKLLNSLYANRDLISRNLHRIFLFIDKVGFNKLMAKYYDLLSVANFAHMFYIIDVDIEDTGTKQLFLHYRQAFHEHEHNNKERLYYAVHTAKWARKMGDFSQALLYLEKAQKILSLLKTNKSLKELEADIYKYYAKTYLDLKDLNLAIEYFQKTVELFGKLVNQATDQDQRDIYFRRKILNTIRLGRAYKESGQLDVAFNIYQQAQNEIKFYEENILSKLKLSGFFFKEKSLLYKELFFYYLAKNESKFAEQILDKKSKLVNTFTNENVNSRAYLHEDKGKYYLFLGKTDKAKENFSEALKIFRKIHLYRNYTSVLLELGKAYFYTNEAGKATGTIMKAVRTSKEHTFYDLLCESLIYLGWVIFHKGHIKKGIDFLKQALELAEKIGFIKGQTKAAFYIVMIYDFLHDLNPSKQYLKKAQQYLQILDITEKVKYQKCIARAHLAKAYYYLKTRDLNTAKNYISKGIALAKKMNFVFLLSSMYFVRGLICLDLQQKDQAFESFADGFEIANEHNYIEGRILNGLHLFDLNQDYQPEESFQHISGLAQICEEARFYIFLPAIYQKLAKFAPDTGTKIYYQDLADFYQVQLLKNAQDLD